MSEYEGWMIVEEARQDEFYIECENYYLEEEFEEEGECA